MFNERWVILIILMMFIGLAINQGGLFVLAVLLGTIVPISWLWNRFSLRRLEYRRLFSENRVFVGESVEMTLQVSNRKILPVPWLRIEDEFPKEVTCLEDESVGPLPVSNLLVNALSLRWYERVSWRYRLRCDNRGYHPFGPASIHAGDLFGLFSQDERRLARDALIVYPQIRPLEEFGLPLKEPFGEIKAQLRIFEDPSRTIGVREYGPGDEFKRIHWKATARRQELQVKVYEPTTTTQLVIVANLATLPKHWQGIIPERLEHTLSLAASLASHTISRRYQVGVLANGCWPFSHQLLKVLPSRNPDQLMHILEALAVVSSMPIMTVEDLLVRESPNLPWGATLVVVTSVLTADILAAMLSLRDAGRRQVLVSADETPEAAQLTDGLSGIVVHHALFRETIYNRPTERRVP